jgi:hypothetical protein
MPNYQVKNVEPIVVSDDVWARVFTLAHGDVPWSGIGEVSRCP